MGRDYKPPIGRSCAICSAFVPLDQGRMEDLKGTGRPDFFVCLTCSDQPIVARRGPDLPYEPEGFVTPAQLTTALRDKMGEVRYNDVNEIDRRAGLAAHRTSKEDILVGDYIADTHERRRRSGGKLGGGKAGIRNTKPSAK
jgi:hypothetical protein